MSRSTLAQDSERPSQGGPITFTLWNNEYDEKLRSHSGQVGLQRGLAGVYFWGGNRAVLGRFPIFVFGDADLIADIFSGVAIGRRVANFPTRRRRLMLSFVWSRE